MRRTQIYIPEQLHVRLHQLATAQSISIAEVVRTLLDERLQEISDRNQASTSVLKSIIAIEATGGPLDLATNHDQYLYNNPTK